MSATRLSVPTATAVVHGDLHFRHLLIDGGRALCGVIDWGDVCLADPCIDLAGYWSLLPPEGRVGFLDEYGPVAEEDLLRARVLALNLCAALAVYGHHEQHRNVKREALAGLARTAAG